MAETGAVLASHRSRITVSKRGRMARQGGGIVKLRFGQHLHRSGKQAGLRVSGLS
jgi:hypothetical protein